MGRQTSVAARAENRRKMMKENEEDKQEGEKKTEET